MSGLRIAFLNAAHDDEHTRRNFRREVDADLVEFDATSGDLPETFGFDAAVVSGSASSVYDDEEWIGTTAEWVSEAIDRGLPFLGVCFGHQLLAHVLGGDVADMGEYELGYREIGRVGDSPLLEGVGDRFTAFTSHSDEVARLPPGAEVIAENDRANQGFRKGRVFGVQFHPEYDVATAEAVTRDKDLPEERIASVLDSVTERNYDAACEAKTLFQNFCECVRDAETAGPTARGRSSTSD